MEWKCNLDAFSETVGVNGNSKDFNILLYFSGVTVIQESRTSVDVTLFYTLHFRHALCKPSLLPSLN